MNNSSTIFHLSPAIVQKLNAVRSTLRRYVLAEGLLLVVLWILLVFWLGAAIDYLPVTAGSNETPHWLRIALLCAMAGGSLWVIVRRIASRLGVALKDESLALLIERRYPELNNELITAVELRERREDVSNPEAHRAMLDRVHAAVSKRIDVVHPVELFDWQPLWTAGVAVAFGSLVTLVATLGMTDWMGRWSRRLFLLSDEPWPRKAVLRADGIQLQTPAFSTQLAAERVMLPFVDNIARVPRGAAAQLQVSADARAKQVPEVCTLYYRTGDGGRGRANLRRVGGPRSGWQRFTLDGPPLDGLSQDMVIDVVGLDARLRDLNIRVVEPAVVSEMRLQCVYPPYLLDSFSARAASETIDYRSGATIPEGTQLTLKGTASGKLSQVEYVIHASDSDTESETTEVQSVQPTEDNFDIPLGELTATQVIEVRLIDEFGLSADQIPSYVITLQEDTIPEVNSQLEGIGLAVTPNAMLPLKGTVEDDHGIQQVSAELVLNESPPIIVPLQVEEGILKSTIDLEQLRAQERIVLEPGATIGLVVTARDYYDLGEREHVGRGQPLQLAIVTADQLLVMLDRQELELRQRLELIMSELQQMREVLQTLKVELTPQTSARRQSPLERSRFTVALVPQTGGSETRTEQVRRLASLWAQQSVLQGDKSQQELTSMAARVDNLRLQLVNNRIDSYDRQERLLTKVHDPLRALLASEYETMRRSLLELQTATLSGGGAQQAADATNALDVVLLQLETIKSNMQDIEDFNEIIDLVRGLLDDQEKVLSETEKEQKQRILDLLR